MRPPSASRFAALIAVTALIAACSQAPGGGNAASVAGVTSAPTTAPASSASSASSAGSQGQSAGYNGYYGGSYGGASGAGSGASPSSGMAQAPTIAIAHGMVGSFLTGANGMTLYVYAKDAPDKSNCSGGCAAAWPPFTVPAGTKLTAPSGAMGAFGTITRSDGSTQVTYNHKPLYHFSGDSAAGQTNGQGVAGLWTVAKP